LAQSSISRDEAIGILLGIEAPTLLHLLEFFYHLSSMKNIFLGLAIIFLCLISCQENTTQKNSERTYRVSIVLSTESSLDKELKSLEQYLNDNTSQTFRISSFRNAQDVLQNFNTKCDIGFINTLSYILLKEKGGVDAKGITVRYGSTTYKGEIITRDTSQVNSLADLQGKSMTYIRKSTSGSLMPALMLNSEHIKPEKVSYVSSHEAAVTAVYLGYTDASACFYGETDANGQPGDARKLIKSKYPDVFNKVRIVKLTDPIPNDPIVFKDEIDQRVVNEFIGAISKFLKTNEGKMIFDKINGLQGITAVKGDEYDQLSSLLTSAQSILSKY
jgi:phosphonate transport system substrate-binding protein